MSRVSSRRRRRCRRPRRGCLRPLARGPSRRGIPVFDGEHFAEGLASVGVGAFTDDEEGVVLFVGLEQIEAAATDEAQGTGLLVVGHLEIETGEEVADGLPMGVGPVGLSTDRCGGGADVVGVVPQQHRRVRPRASV